MSARITVTRLARWLFAMVLLGSMTLLLVGRTDLPRVWVWFGILSATTLGALFFIPAETFNERLQRGRKTADPLALTLIRLAMAATIVVSLLDVGRLGWSGPVPLWLSGAASVAMAAAMAWVFWAIATNRFFMPQVRIQEERGHHLVDTGPYAIVRHPGYAGMMLFAPAGALALGSWPGLVLGLVGSAAFAYRAAGEDRFLHANLSGYPEFARRTRYRVVPGVWVLVGLVAASAAGCGVLFTDAPDPSDLFDAPLDGLSPQELAAFAEGDAQFGKRFAPVEGLGPIFNNVSCASCHSGDGRGRPENALTRFGSIADPMLEYGAPQIQHRAIAGTTPEYLPAGTNASVRLPPPVFGVGLIEAIPDSAILAHVDSLDSNGDGISGRPNFVTPPDFVPANEPGGGPQPRLGRFSRKAQVASILHQTVGAYHEDMGISSDFLPVELAHPQGGTAGQAADRVVDPEIPASVVRVVVNYLRMLAPPAPGAMNASRLRGQLLFDSIGCAACHVPTLRTGASTIQALANRDANLYSDLLLHDMGPGLADNRPDGAAGGSEWKTPPLWGLRLVPLFLNGEAFYLHDGRARSLEEALLLHGGEAQGARDRFSGLGVADRAALLDFVGSR